MLGFTRLTGFATDAFERVLLRYTQGGATLRPNRHLSPDAGDPFNERRGGLDHLALRVADQESLEH